MAFSSIQGYVKALNLTETEQDRQALNNLGTAPIADDIALFINNTKNESVIEIKPAEYNTSTNVITIVNETLEEGDLRANVFTNGDKVELRNTDNVAISSTLYIKDSNGIDTFSLATDADLQTTYSGFFPTENFLVVRQDIVTAENLSYLGVARSSTSTTSVPGIDGEGAGGAEDPDIDNFGDKFNELYGYLDISNFISQTKYTQTDDVATAEKLRIEGDVVIKDPADTIINEGLVASSPGLYLSNPASPVDNIQRTRAFSSTSNPWTDNYLGTLSTDSVDVTAGNLILTGGFNVSGITKAASNGTVNNTTFTHKIKIQIDGIDYFLCLTS
jgi:hypothetical protein